MFVPNLNICYNLSVMFSFFWTNFFYQPLFNALIWIYVNIAPQNLGWAVLWLTIFLRLILLPLTIVSERDALKQFKMEQEAKEKVKAFKNDPVTQKEEIRKVMRKNKISPWAKVITLGVQLLVLILLYQVFIRGITGDRVMKILYSWVEFPGKINTNFYGFEIGNRHDSLWAGLAAVYLFVSILISNKKEKWERSRAAFLFLFPLFTFYALWMLPMVKSIFILTTMIFSDTISTLRRVFFPVKDTNI